MENSLQKLIKTFESDITVGSKVMDLLSRYSGRVSGIARLDVFVVCRWQRPTGDHRRGVAIPSYTMEKSLQKLLKTFERDPMVESKVMDLLSRYSGVSVASLDRRSSSWSSDSTLLHGKQPTETHLNI
ncbi:hypothetical protein D5086_031841 [Populus alba]|uniref:Uncharacterized protein n=1 Tax=Populus alba TaxID=43335 RepID=A0ACC4AJR5_POPAL